MDHRCLYGHRVLASFTFAIQSRSCPTCGSSTVSVAGYQAARKLSLEGGMDALSAFNAVRLIESAWQLVPTGTVAAAGDVGTRAPALAEPEDRTVTAAIPVPTVDEVEVVDEQDSLAGPAPTAPAGAATTTVVAEGAPAVRPVVRGRGKGEARSFEPGEEAFFKGD
jgi:hypothetical protein